MTVTNKTLLESQPSIQKLANTDLRGIHALHLKEIVNEVNERLQKIQEVREEIQQKENGEEEWEELMDGEVEIDKDPLPQEAFREAEISATLLMQLDWMIETNN